MLGGVGSVEPFITVNKKSESNPDLVVLNLSLLSINSLNQTQTAIFTLLLQILLPGDYITRIYCHYAY